MVSCLRVMSVLSLSAGLVACSATSTSTMTPEAKGLPAYTGKVFVTEKSLPPGTKFIEVGQVEANIKSGYESGTKLYPLLADEARKLGANAVIEVGGGRRPTLLSWAAAFVYGKAIKIDNLEALKGVEGAEH
ncbi:MAG: hypothetical protein AB8C46_06410 [Burkholderiaceae bacterium]